MSALLEECGGQGPDIFHALGELLDRDRDSACPGRASELGRTYQLACALDFDDEVGEKDQVLARLAFLGWDYWRRKGACRETREWQARCVSHVIQQVPARDYLTLAPESRTAALNRRFLGDEAVLLTVYDSVTGERANLEPARVSREAEALYYWLVEDAVGAGLRFELTQYFASGAALYAALTQCALGRGRSRIEWLGMATQHASRCNGSDPLLASIEHGRLISLYQERVYSEVKAKSPALIVRFSSLGMDDKALRATLLRGRTLKELGEYVEALSVLHAVHAEGIRKGDLLVAALALCDRAEMLNSQGSPAAALVAWNEAIVLAERSGCRWVVANVQGTLGELLRDNGQLSASIDAYSASIRSYEALEMRFLAAYTRIVLAEALLLADLPSRALGAIVEARPLIESQDLTHEAFAAVGILREAMRRQQPRPDTVRKLRVELQSMRAEGRL